jgi:hypothetical protein
MSKRRRGAREPKREECLDGELCGVDDAVSHDPLEKIANSCHISYLPGQGALVAARPALLGRPRCIDPRCIQAHIAPPFCVTCVGAKHAFVTRHTLWVVRQYTEGNKMFEIATYSVVALLAVAIIAPILEAMFWTSRRR